MFIICVDLKCFVMLRVVDQSANAEETGQEDITFRVSVLHNPSAQWYSSNRDSTSPRRVIVLLDSDEREFFQTLRENFPDLPGEFELCRVNGQRMIIPLNLQSLCPREIQSNNALGRSALYIRPKGFSGQAPSNTATQSTAALSQVPPSTTQSTAALSQVPPCTPQSTAALSQVPPCTPQSTAALSQVPPSTTQSTAALSQVPPSTPQSTEALSQVPPATYDQNEVIREDFYVDSCGSDIEEVFLATPDQNIIEYDEKDLAQILKEFREEHIDLTMTITVIVRRKYILQSACTALSRSYFNWHKVPNVEFVGEMAEDYGGPRREFFRLLMIEIQQRLGVFVGKPGQLLFSYDQRALSQNKFYTGGKLIAWSIVHNGPGVRSLSRELFLLMCGQKTDFSSFDLSNFQDEELQNKLQKVAVCTTHNELDELKRTLGDFIAECGVPNIFTASLTDLPTVYEQIITHHLYHSVNRREHGYHI
ncbi:uncharacterized protein [Hoplias malabaricus]|uniref:uncharacterized protein n=1 Tax=Hoplias malabaricus TaxID=27720 RepID=UPI003462DA1B